MSDLTPTQQKIKDAIELASKNCGGKLHMQAAVGATASWLYACISRSSVPIELAMKLEILTRGEYSPKDLCPEKIEEIEAVAEFLKP